MPARKSKLTKAQKLNASTNAFQFVSVAQVTVHTPHSPPTAVATLLPPPRPHAWKCHLYQLGRDGHYRAVLTQSTGVLHDVPGWSPALDCMG